MPRDLEILRWIARHGLVTPSQVAERFFSRDDGRVGIWAAYGRLRALQQLGHVRRDRTFWGADGIIRLTREGADIADVGLGPARLIFANVPHDTAVVDLIEDLLADNPGATFETERELVADRYAQLRIGRRSIALGRMPDGVLTLADGTTVALELDLTPKRSRHVESIVSAYLSASWDRLWWFVTSPRIAVRYRDVIQAHRADDVMEVRVWQP
jgi:hypothetical protein